MIAPCKLKKNSFQTVLILLFFIVTLPSSAQVQIWGASHNGGEDAIGNVFAVNADGEEYLLKSSFLNEVDGDSPRTRLILGQGNWYYGTTAMGGDYGAGTLYRYHEENGFEVLHHFVPETDGSISKTDMIFINPQTLVGSTSTEGEHGSGMIFTYSTISGYSNLYALDESVTGSNMHGALTHNSYDDLIYATCTNGGEHGFGTLLVFDLQFTFEVAHHFTGGEGGAYPQGGIATSDINDVYGVTQFGGTNSQGTIFKYNPEEGIFEVLYNLDAVTSDGRYPSGTLAQYGENTFIGTCAEGGSSGTGTIFTITTDGEFENLRNLQSFSDGAFPKTGLTQVSEGTYYGVAEFGGENGSGTLFSIDSEGNFSTQHNFSYSEDGSGPIASLTKITENTIIGVNSDGGANDKGTIYTFGDGFLETNHHMSVPKDGAHPQSVINHENSFYGTSELGGEHNAGVFFKIQLDGSREVIHEFEPSYGGQSPNEDLIFDVNNLAYGTARFGGALQLGTIYTITDQGEMAPLHHFTGGMDGQFPYAGLTRHSNGALYGTTISGGTFGNGVIFTIDENLEYTVLYSLFSFFDGGSPESTLIEGDNGKLYGVATLGGTFNEGTLYEFDINTNTLTVLHNFQGVADGRNPKGNLILHQDGSLYGSTSAGLNGGGSLFKYDFSTGFEVVHAFDLVNEGGTILGGLNQDLDGNIYGFTSTDGLFGAGSCFVYNESEGLNIVKSFTNEDSPTPSGTPALFFPECFDTADCDSEEPCFVGMCEYGLCTQVAINPTFESLNIGICQVGLDQFDLTFSLHLEASPGGIVEISGQQFELSPDIYDYTFTVTGLPADNNEIVLPYTFLESGCTGNSSALGQAPEPCPPVEVTFTVHTDGLEINPEGIHLGGSFQNWSPEEYPLSELEEGLWQTTITVGSGNHEFNFFNGSSLFDGEYVIGDCANNGKRELELGDESIEVEYCWSNCGVNCTVGLSALNERIDLTIAPNIVSAGTDVRVSFDQNEDVASYAVTDMNGRIILNEVLNQGNFTIETAGLSTGMYLVKMKNADNQIVGIGRFIIQ